MFAEVDRSIADDPSVRSICGALSEQTLEDGWHRVEFASADLDPRPRLAGILLANGVRMRALGVTAASLESVFVDLVRGASTDAAASAVGGSRR